MALREGFAPPTSSFANWRSVLLSFRSMKMAGVMGLAPTYLQRDGLASRLLRLHAQMAAATGFAPVRPGSEPGRLLLPHAAMEQHGGSAPPTPVWKTGVCLSTPVLRKMVPRIGLAPMTSCSSGRRSTWTELPWVSNWWVRGESHSHEKSRRPLKPVRLLFRHGPDEMVGRTGLAPVKPGGQRFYRPPVWLLTHRPVKLVES